MDKHLLAYSKQTIAENLKTWTNQS